MSNILDEMKAIWMQIENDLDFLEYASTEKAARFFIAENLRKYIRLKCRWLRERNLSRQKETSGRAA